MDTIKIKNYQLIEIFKVLDYEMPFKANRTKNKFLNILQPNLQSFEKDRIQLAEEHSEKDENGQPVIENNSYKIIDLNEYNNLYKTMAEEDNTIQLPTDILVDCVKMIENSPVELDNRSTFIIEEVLNSLNKSSNDKENKKA